MFRGIVYGFLIGIVITGLFWFFAGRYKLEGIQETARAIRAENGTAQQIGSRIGSRFDRLTESASRLNKSSERLEAGSIRVTARGENLDSRSEDILNGIRKLGERINRVEGRHRQIIGIVGTLRGINEDFREANQGRNNEE